MCILAFIVFESNDTQSFLYQCSDLRGDRVKHAPLPSLFTHSHRLQIPIDRNLEDLVIFFSTEAMTGSTDQ